MRKNADCHENGQYIKSFFQILVKVQKKVTEHKQKQKDKFFVSNKKQRIIVGNDRESRNLFMRRKKERKNLKNEKIPSEKEENMNGVRPVPRLL